MVVDIQRTKRQIIISVFQMHLFCFCFFFLEKPTHKRIEKTWTKVSELQTIGRMRWVLKTSKIVKQTDAVHEQQNLTPLTFIVLCFQFLAPEINQARSCTKKKSEREGTNVNKKSDKIIPTPIPC